MKPLYIEMKFFGSYKNVKIDFSQVNSGIFLITGDTGAGKTTIFDAITYALYGKSSGGKRDGEMMISQFAAPDEAMEVIFCFQYGKDKYTVKRSPGKQYKEQLDDNKNKTYVEIKNPKPILELTMPDGTLFNGKKTEIDQKIQEIVGIDASQFVQIAMLAQGDFLKLLHAKSDERQKIFAKIFDTSLYAMIQKELDNQFRTLTDELKDNQKEIEKSLSRIVCTEESNLSNEWRENGKFSDDKSSILLELIQKIIEELDQLNDKNKEELTQYNEDKEKVQKLLNEAEQRNKDFDDLDKTQKNMDELQLKKKDIEEKEKQYKNSQKAKNVFEFYKSYKDKEKALHEKTTSVDILFEKLEQCKEKAEEQYNKKLESDKKYKEEFDTKIKEISLLEEEIRAFEKIEEDEKLYQLEWNKLKEKQNDQSNNEIKETSTKKQVDKLTEDVKNCKESAGKLDAIQRSLDNYERDKIDLKKFKSLLESKEKFNEEIQAQQTQCNNAQKEREELEIKYNQLYDEFINRQVHIIRKRLIEGEPCPVCGSRHHDITNFEEVEVVSEQEVKEIKEQLDSAREKENTKRDKLTSLQSRESENKKQIIEYKNQSELYQNMETSKDIDTSIETTENKITELKQQQSIALNAQKSLQTKELELQKATEKLQNIQDEKKQIADEVISIHSRTDQMKKELDKKKENLSCATKEEAQKKLSQTEQYKDELKKNKEKNEESYQFINKEKTTLQTSYDLEMKAKDDCAKQEKMAKDEFFENLTKDGFFTEQEFLTAKKSEKETQQLNNEVIEYNQTVQTIQVTIKILTDRTENKQRIDDTTYKIKKKEIERNIEKLQKYAKDIYAKSDANQKAKQEIEQYYNDREKLKDKYVVLKNLNDTANGKLSGKKIDFQTYIQRRYFKKVIDAANMRLIKMTNNQFCLKCRDIQELKKVGNVGLDLDVYSIVNDQIRDVKTLSGGESFMASLSMALGLADIIQNKAGKIKIQTMFIDEGFGTLSDDVRNQALEILSELFGENILIGIISHVKELREQIDTQLLVTKTKDGSKAEWKM